MRILKSGKAKCRKFTCSRCGCVFVAEKTEGETFLAEYHETETRVICPCGMPIRWDMGEPYEEPAQEDSRLKLIFLIKNFRACNLETADCEADFLIANGVTFREE